MKTAVELIQEEEDRKFDKLFCPRCDNLKKDAYMEHTQLECDELITKKILES